MAVINVVAACNTPHSIAEAIAGRSDEFPKNSYVLVPPADLQRLGETFELLDSSHVHATGAKCFYVAPVVGAGLNKIELSYKAGIAFQAEVKEIAAQVGAELRNDDKATIALEDLQIVEGFGVPIRGSACGFKDGLQTASVITATVVAGTAKVEFSRNLAVKARGGGGWGTGSANGSGAIKLNQSGQLQGTNIVVVASVTSVDVRLSDKKTDLGATPANGTVVSFPPGFDGNVSVDSLNTEAADHIPRLTITAHTTMGASAQNVPAMLEACVVEQSMILTPGKGCFVWNQSGASGVNVWFEKVPVDGADHIVLHLDGHATTFTPRRMDVTTQ